MALAQGQPVGAVVRTLGISEPTDDRGRREYGGLRVDQAKRLQGLERENSRRKRLVADQALDNAMVRDVAAGNFCARPSGAGRRPPAPTSPPCRSDGPARSPARRGHRRASCASRRRMRRRGSRASSPEPRAAGATATAASPPYCAKQAGASITRGWNDAGAQRGDGCRRNTPSGAVSGWRTAR